VARERDNPAKRRSRGHPRRAEPSLDEALRRLGATILDEPVPETLYRALDSRSPSDTLGQHGQDTPRTRPSLDQLSFRESLLFSIDFAVAQNRDLLRRILKEDASGAARDMLVKRVLEQLELCGFEINEDQQVMTRHDRGRG
jgi:hypothetical protein